MATADNIKYATLLPNKDKLSLKQFDVFDRIINLKITTSKVSSVDEQTGEVKKIADEFIIRSDYELTYPNQSLPAVLKGKSKDGGYLVQRCNYKPSIKIQYNQVSNSTSIGVDIFISNFFITTKDGRNLMSFNEQSYKIVEVEVQMGYIGQFNKLLGLDARNVTDLTPDDLFNFKAGFGVDVLKMTNVNYVTTEKLPPDYAICIHGYVGNTIQSAPMISKNNITFEDIPKDYYFNVSKGLSDYENIFYNYITRRYLNQIAFDIKKGEKYPEADDSGRYSESDADKYGVKVICSPGVKEYEILNNMVDNEGNEVSIEDYLDLGGANNSLNSAMHKILNYTGKTILYSRLNNGDFLAYLKSEIEEKTIAELFNDPKLMKIINDNQTKEYYNNIIPGVYNLNIDAGLATIVCPFFAWINPFQELKFASRYAMTSLSAFYANFTPVINKFYAINVQVTFATVEDANEMQIVAVPYKE